MCDAGKKREHRAASAADSRNTEITKDESAVWLNILPSKCQC